MNLRSQSLNHGVCDAISASAMMPTLIVPTSATTCRAFRMYFLVGDTRLCSILSPLKGLSNREVEAEASSLRLAVHQQPGQRIELVAEVHADRTDRRQVAQAGARAVAQVVEGQVPGGGPDG